MKTTNKRLELYAVICTNDEINRDTFGGLVDFDEHSADEQHAVDEIVRAIIAAADRQTDNYATDSRFFSWSGGRFANNTGHNATHYPITGGIVQVFEATEFFDSDGELLATEPCVVRLTDYTDEHRAAVRALEVAIDAAIIAEVRSINQTAANAAAD